MYLPTNQLITINIYTFPCVCTQLSDDGTAALRMKAFTESGSHMAYGVSRSGSDWQSIYVRDVETCEDLTLDDSKEALEWVKFSSISWTHDDKGFFYSRYPKPEVLDENDEDFKRGSETQVKTVGYWLLHARSFLPIHARMLMTQTHTNIHIQP